MGIVLAAAGSASGFLVAFHRANVGCEHGDRSKCRVKEDKRSGMRSDRNSPDDPECIVRLIGQVIRVSFETVTMIQSIPERYAAEAKPS